MSRRLSAALAVIGIGIASCSSSGADSGRTSGNGDGMPETGESVIAALPERPAELGLDGVEVCELFTTDALNDLAITKNPRPGTEGGEATCMLSAARAEPMYDLLITAHPAAGVEQWITGDRARPPTMETAPVTVAGYPAVRVYPAERPTDECDVVAGVAQGQALHVRFGTSYRGEFEHDKACALAEQAATAAVTALAEDE